MKAMTQKYTDEHRDTLHSHRQIHKPTQRYTLVIDRYTALEYIHTVTDRYTQSQTEYRPNRDTPHSHS